MSEHTKSRKPLIVGIIAAVVILGALLALVLTQCTGPQTPTESTPAATTTVQEETPTYDIYWNIDRALYDGKSDAGMSSRQPAADGFFYVRFFKDGQTVELKVADRKTVNSIEVNDLMGLKFDQDGVVVGIVPLDELPLDTKGSDFFVQSYGTGVLKINSSNSFNGMEMMLSTKNALGIWDMTGMEGEPGTEIRPIGGDRVKIISNLDGDVTHVFVYSRPEYMRTFKAECEHCKKVVEWKMYTKTNTLPNALGGHYQLQNDIQLKSAISLADDMKLCLDLNGYTVNGAQNKRVISTWGLSSELALMDTSESQKGRIVAHNETVSSSQGYAVLVYKGAFYMYGGTLDASDAVTGLFGAAVSVTKQTYFYMFGGTIIGGTAKCMKKEGTNNYSGGVGGSVAVYGKFVMNGGTIRDGKAEGVVTAYGADGMPSSFQRGLGGNVYVDNGCEFVMNGGTIKNGSAYVKGGNVYLHGSATMTLNGGTITGGKVTGYGRQGGNIVVDTKAELTINGGYITNGQAYDGGGNVHNNGRITMNDGYISGGIIRNYKTNKVKQDDNRSNLFVVNGHFYMYGGEITGSALIIDTTVGDKHRATLALGGLAKILGPENKTCADLTLSASGDGVRVLVYKLLNGAKIGINAPAGIFTEKTDASNLDNFIPYVENMEMSHVDGCLALGRQGCLCGKNKEGEHIGECDGSIKFWTPVNNSLKVSASGYVYLTQDLEVGQRTIGEGVDLVIDLNGYTLSGKAGTRVLMAQGEGAKITIIDSSEAQTGKLRAHGQAENVRGGLLLATAGGEINLYGGTFDASEFSNTNGWNAGKDGVYGTSDDKDAASDGGAVVIGANCTVNMYGGKLIGAKLEARELVKTVTEGEGESATTKEVKRTVAQPSGAAIDLSNGSVFNLYGGTIVGNSAKAGGVINCAATGVINLMGGTVEGGSATDGGNICLSNKDAVLNISGETVIQNGTASNNGGNICVKNGTVNVSDDVQILNGTAKFGGNIHSSGSLTITGGEVKGGTGKSYGPTNNIYVVASTLVLRGGVIDGGLAVTNNETTRATVTISGNPVVNSASTGLNLIFTSSSTLGLPLIAVDGEITEGASIALTTKEDGVFTVELSAADAEAVKGVFTPCNASKSILIRNGETADTYQLWIGVEVVEDDDEDENEDVEGGEKRTRCLCGSESENPNDHSLGCREAVLTKGGEKNNGQAHEWTEWTEDSLPTTSGYYFLNQEDKIVDISPRYAPEANAVIVLDLNGHTVLDKTARVLCTWDESENVSLTITDTAGDGVICFSDAVNLSEVAGMIGLGKTSQLNLVAGTLDASNLTLNGTGGNGGVLYVSADSVFNMYGGALLSANSVYNGGAIALVGGEVNIYAGQIVGGTATNEGGAIYMSTGTLNISGGTITARENANAKNGGLIAVNGGNATISGTAQISGGAATSNGGNIYIKVGATLEVQDNAQIFAGTSSASSAGNIYVAGKLIVSGGRIFNGNSNYDSAENIYVFSGTLELRGGEIDGSVLALNFNDANSTVKISGNPVVGNKQNGLNLSYSMNSTTGIPMIQLDGALTAGASIVISTKDDGLFTQEFDAADLEAIRGALTPAASGKTITAVAGATDGTYQLSIGATE